MSTDYANCARCRRPTHIDLLDAKDGGDGDYTILECPACYGPGYVPALASQWPWAIWLWLWRSAGPEILLIGALALIAFLLWRTS